MMRALKGTGVSEQIAPDSAEGNWFAHNSGLVVVVIWLFTFHEFEFDFYLQFWILNENEDKAYS